MLLWPQVVEEVTVCSGSVVDSLAIRTTTGVERRWGGKGGHGSHTWRIPANTSLLGFHGGVGGHVHCLGVIVAEQGGESGPKQGDINPTHRFLPQVPRCNASTLITNLYSGVSVRRIYVLLLVLNPQSRDNTNSAANSNPAAAAFGNVPQDIDAVHIALKVAVKYADNLLATPLEPRVSHIRIANNFFCRKIGQLAGSGLLMNALGFEAAEDGGHLQYVFRRNGAGRGLVSLRNARQALADIVEQLDKQ